MKREIIERVDIDVPSWQVEKIIKSLIGLGFQSKRTGPKLIGTMKIDPSIFNIIAERRIMVTYKDNVCDYLQMKCVSCGKPATDNVMELCSKCGKEVAESMAISDKELEEEMNDDRM